MPGYNGASHLTLGVSIVADAGTQTRRCMGTEYARRRYLWYGAPGGLQSAPSRSGHQKVNLLGRLNTLRAPKPKPSTAHLFCATLRKPKPPKQTRQNISDTQNTLLSTLYSLFSTLSRPVPRQIRPKTLNERRYTAILRPSICYCSSVAQHFCSTLLAFFYFFIFFLSLLP